MGNYPDGWNNPAHPPAHDAIDLGGGVWATWHWGRPSKEKDLLIWHFCDHNVWITKAEKEGRKLVEEHVAPSWAPCGVQSHTLVSEDPLTLNPSLAWWDCCALHGWVENGKWRKV